MNNNYEHPFWLTILMMAVSSAGLIGNTIVCLTILRVKCLQDLTHYLILNLAVSDLLACFMFLMHRILESLHLQLSDAHGLSTYLYCHLIFSGYIFFSLSYASVYNLLIITLERYVVIVYPLRYMQFYTKRRACVAVLAAWVAGFSLYLIHLVGVGVDVDEGNPSTNYCIFTHSWALHFLPFTAGFLLPLAAMIFAYYRIIATLKQSSLRRGTLQNQAMELAEARRRVVNLTLLVTATFVLLYGVTQPSNMMMMVMNKDTYEAAKDFRTLKCLLRYLLTEVPMMINSVVNPIIYAFKYKKFRQGLREGLCPCLKPVQVSTNGSTVKRTNGESVC